MTLYSLAGLTSSIILFLPVIVILTLRLAWYKSFPALVVYYLLVSFYNFITLDFFTTDKIFISYLSSINNLLDAPLMLSFMTYFSRTAVFKKRMKWVIGALVLFELVVIAFSGFDLNRAAVISLAPGLSLVLAFTIIFFVHQAKITVVYQKAAGKAFIAASLLFAYCGYSFVYIVYYLLKTPHKTDTHIVYYTINILSCLLISIGIFLERKRVKQINEVKIARQELKVIYGRS